MNATSLDKQKKGNNLYVYKFGAGSKTPEYQPPTAAAVTKRIISSSVWGSLRKSKSKPKVKEKEEEGNGNNAKITEKELVKSNGYGNGNGNGRRSVSSVEAILLNLASGKTEGRKSVTLSQSVDEGKGKEFPFPFPYPQVHCKGKLEESRKSVSYVESNMGKVGMKKVVMMEKPRKSTGAKLESNVESAVALLQVKVLVTDMPGFMQVHAFQCARNTYDSLEKFSAKHLASNLKKEFDKTYGPAWHCIVGSSFGSFVTHATGCFLYFSMEKLCILLFRTKVQRALKQ